MLDLDVILNISEEDCKIATMIFTKHSSYVKPLKERLAAVPFVFQALPFV